MDDGRRGVEEEAMRFGEWRQRYHKTFGVLPAPGAAWAGGRLELLDELREHPRIRGLGGRQYRAICELLDEITATECGVKEDDRG